MVCTLYDETLALNSLQGFYTNRVRGASIVLDSEGRKCNVGGEFENRAVEGHVKLRKAQDGL